MTVSRLDSTRRVDVAGHSGMVVRALRAAGVQGIRTASSSELDPRDHGRTADFVSDTELGAREAVHAYDRWVSALPAQSRR